MSCKIEKECENCKYLMLGTFARCCDKYPKCRKVIETTEKHIKTYKIKIINSLQKRKNK